MLTAPYTTCNATTGGDSFITVIGQDGEPIPVIWEDSTARVTYTTPYKPPLYRNRAERRASKRTPP